MQDYSGYGQPPAGDDGFGGSTLPFPQGPPPPRPPRRRVGFLSYLAVALAAGALGAGAAEALEVGWYSATTVPAPRAPAASATAR